MQPLRIALLTTERAPGLAQLLEDPNRGATWELSLVVDSELQVPKLADANPDYILVDGYPHILPDTILEKFPRRIFALHHDDVRKAILLGELETRSSVYVVTEKAGNGALFLLSAPYPIAPLALDARERGDVDSLALYADLHRRWMIETSSGAMLVRTLELLAGGTMQIIHDVVWIDGAPGPCRMGHAPQACHEPEAMLARGIPRSCPFIG